MTAPMADGPMPRGIASGTTLMSPSCLVRGWVQSSFISEMAVKKSSRPTPMRKASRVKPNSVNRCEPNKKRNVPMMKIATDVLQAVRAFCSLSRLLVPLIKALSTAGGVISAYSLMLMLIILPTVMSSIRSPDAATRCRKTLRVLRV